MTELPEERRWRQRVPLTALRGALIFGLVSLLEVVLGPLWVWLALSERPGTATLAGGAIVIAAIVIQTYGAPASERGGMAPPRSNSCARWSRPESARSQAFKQGLAGDPSEVTALGKRHWITSFHC